MAIPGDIPAFTAFIRSSYVQRRLKEETQQQYERFSPSELDAIASGLATEATTIPDDALLLKLDPTKGVTLQLLQAFTRSGVLPADWFNWQAYRLDDLVPTLWVNDVPHRITHQSLRQMVSFATSPEAAAEAPEFYKRVKALASVPVIRSLPVLVVAPARSQRSGRQRHRVDHDRPPSPFCEAGPIVEGLAHIEDGNHRAVAEAIRAGGDIIRVIKMGMAERKQ